MIKLKSSGSLFVDLFYAVVVASTVPRLYPFPSLQQFIFQFLWIIAVLEDWYLYHRHVVDPEDQAISYTFKSLFIEVSILTSWLLGFTSLSQPVYQNWFFVFLALFYGIKILGGVSSYLRHGTFFSRKMLYDLLWLPQIVIALLAFWSIIDSSFTCQFIIVAAITSTSLSIWWILTTYFPTKK